MSSITYEQMYDVLRDLGFEERAIPGSHVSFVKDVPPVTILLPQMRLSLHVKPVHLRMVVHQLVTRSILTEERWDRLVHERVSRRRAANQ